MIIDSGNYMERAFAPALAVYQEAVYRNTWGHLAPKPAEIYTGSILFAYGEYGEVISIKSLFVDSKGAELDSSPWYHEELHSYLNSRLDRRNVTEGRVYRFTGTLRELKTTGRLRFSGKVRVVHT